MVESSAEITLLKAQKRLETALTTLTERGRSVSSALIQASGHAAQLAALQAENAGLRAELDALKRDQLDREAALDTALQDVERQRDQLQSKYDALTSRFSDFEARIERGDLPSRADDTETIATLRQERADIRSELDNAIGEIELLMKDVR